MISNNSSKIKAYTDFVNSPNGNLRDLFDKLSADEQRAIYEGYAYHPDEGLWEGYEMPYGMSLDDYRRRVVNNPDNYELFLATLS